MVGQEKLKQKIDNLIASRTFPRTLMLEGDKGCGKHLFSEIISEKLNVQLQDITESLNLETLTDISLRPEPFVYRIDCTVISEREQNVILKFLEEPLKNAYIILLCESRYRLLPTVMNRCQVFTFEQYSVSELKSLVDYDVMPQILDYADTPGRLLDMLKSPIDKMLALSNQIFDSISRASYSNILRIPDRLYYKEPVENKLDFSLFSYIFIRVARDKYVSRNIAKNVYDLTDTFYNNCSIPRIDKQRLFEHYIVELKLLLAGVIFDEI